MPACARPLLPEPLGRLAVLVPFALLGAVQWARMVADASAWRTLGSLAIALGGAAAVLAAERYAGRRRVAVVLVAALAALVAAVLMAGVPLRLLAPAHWGELSSGVASGLEALSSVRLPYAGSDPWPRITLQLGATLLLVLSALLSVWPRTSGGHGHVLVGAAGLVALVVVPAVAIGNDRPALVGLLLALVTIAFLFADRLPARPGVGVGVLCALALLAALPLAATADRNGPWFDYRSFAERIGTDDPIRFDWSQTYGPIAFPRDGREVLRVTSPRPLYWKAANLDRFDGDAWVEGGRSTSQPAEDLSPSWHRFGDWTAEIRVRLRRLRSRQVIGAGTMLAVAGATRDDVRPGPSPGLFSAGSELRGGDSYTALVHVPRPQGDALAVAPADPYGRRREELGLLLVLDQGVAAQSRLPSPEGTSAFRRPLATAELSVPSWEERSQRGAQPTVRYRQLGLAAQPAEPALRSSPYWRAWQLALRLRRGAATPYEYLRAVDDHLRDGFTYDERPPPPAAGRPSLDAFLFDGRTGHCQHFAGAMALLLRMGGVPARVATGFSPGGYSRRADAWIVRDSDAHAWVEAWFEPFGWVTFDPTPDATPARSQIAALSPAPRSQRERRSRGASEPGAADEAPPGARGTRADLLRESGDRSTVESGAGGDGAGSGTPWGFVGGAALLGALGGGALWLRARRRRALALAGGGPAELAVAELRRALVRTGRDLPPATTLTQLTRRYGETPEAADYLRALRTARYAPTTRGGAPSASGRAALRRELALGLGLSGRLRALWALPPRLRQRSP